MSDSEFRDVFNLLVSRTDEYAHLLPLLESILPSLSRTDALLDVGAGPGLFSAPLSTHFDHIGIVEPDPVYCLEVVQKILPMGKLVTAYKGMWEAARFREQQFDLIICAHVLYFVAPDSWDAFIQKMVRHLAPNGRMVIALAAKGDNTSEVICRTLGIEAVGSYPFSAAAIECLQAHNSTFDVRSFEASITAETADTLLEVLALFPIMQYDQGSSKEQRLAMIDTHFKDDGQYRMPYTVDVLIVKAPGYGAEDVKNP